MEARITIVPQAPALPWVAIEFYTIGKLGSCLRVPEAYASAWFRVQGLGSSTLQASCLGCLEFSFIPHSKIPNSKADQAEVGNMTQSVEPCQPPVRGAAFRSLQKPRPYAPKTMKP